MTIQRKRVAKRLASGLVAGALALGGLAISGGSVSAKTPVSKSTDRIGGDDRYETAALLAEAYNPTNFGDNGVIVASGEQPYDALAASSLAGYVDAPIILVKKDSVPESVADLLSDNVANFRGAVGKKVYFIGGTSAISDEVKDAVMAIVTAGDLTPITSTRISGATRYETAVAISKVAGLTLASDTVIIANGADGKWADALSAGQLAASKKWPIILTGDGGLNAAAQARVLEYINLSSSALKFLLVGGAAVLPTSIEDFLVANDVPVANIYRRGGVDRYHTNVLMNQALLINGSEAGLRVTAMAAGGNGVALASGSSPWDALAAGPWAAKTSYHLVLTGAAPGAFTAGLVGALSVGFNQPGTVKVIGGKNAVSNATRDVVLATASGAVDTTTALSGCVAGASTVYFTIVGGIGSPTASRNETLNNTITGSANAYWSIDGVKDSATSFFGGYGVSTFVDISTKDDGVTLKRETFALNLDRELVADEVLAFAGVNEVVPGGAGINRAVAGTSCTVAADTVEPTATIRPITDGDNLVAIVVNLSEPMTKSTASDSSTLDATAASLAASNYWDFSYSEAGPSVAAANQSTLSAVALNSSYTSYLVTVSGANIDVNTADTVTLAKEAIVDVVGNGMAADVAATALPDSTPATMSLSAPTCMSSGAAVITKAPLTLTAVTAANGGAWHGRKANGIKLRVVNQRGLSIPTIEFDSANSVIVVTADTGYHTPADLLTVSRNTGFSANWAITTSTTKLVATVVDVAYTTAGTDDCTTTITFSEPAYTSATNRALTAAGVTLTAPSDYVGTWKNSDAITFTTSALGAATLVLSASTVNQSNVSGATTASTSLP